MKNICSTFLILLVLFANGPANCMTEKEILASADERIEEYRKGDCVIKISTKDSQSLKGISVVIEQTNHEFLFGCALLGWFFEPEHWQKKISIDAVEKLEAVFNCVAYYHMGWNRLEPERGKREYEKVKEIANFWKEKNIIFKGHALVYHAFTPKWLKKKDDIELLLKNHVIETLKEYKGLIDFWDLVNESTVEWDDPIGNWEKEVGYRKVPMMALEWANEANSEALLLLNDYRLVEDYEKQIEYLADNKVQGNIAVGLQSYMHDGNWPIEKVWNICERFGRFGFPLHFTELAVVSGDEYSDGDAPDYNWGPTTPKGEKIQAEYLEKLYTVLFSHPSVESVIWWGGIADEGGAPSGLLRREFSPKPAYDKLYNLIKKKWWTEEVRGKTNDKGEFKFRGFYGTYRIMITYSKGKKIEKEFYLRKNLENVLEFSI